MTLPTPPGPIKIYIAGKVSPNSSFGKRHWRANFCRQLADLTGLPLKNLDPLAGDISDLSPEDIFRHDCTLIRGSDLVVAYLSDDISVGGSQEILIAKYYNKSVIALAPLGGKFNGSPRTINGKTIDHWRDPFVFSTCDIVCPDIDSAARQIVAFSLGTLSSKPLSTILPNATNHRNNHPIIYTQY